MFDGEYEPVGSRRADVGFCNVMTPHYGCETGGLHVDAHR